MDHLLARHVKTESEYHPILMSEPPVSITVFFNPSGSVVIVGVPPVLIALFGGEVKEEGLGTPLY